jgi:dephospho-CoA kinase
MVKKPNKKIILGVTGSLGSGKSTVARMFEACGGEVIDADKIGHSYLDPGTGIYRKIIKVFGNSILNPDRSIDRHKLSGLAFRDRKNLNKLNRILHPRIIREIKSRIKYSKSSVLILDAPLLIEFGLQALVDKLIVVKINRVNQLKRLSERKVPLSNKQALRRIKFQMPLKDKIRLADFVIDNNGTLSQTRKQVGQIRRLLWRS